MNFENDDCEIEKFQKIYKKYVQNMNSREFANLIIKYGGLDTRIKIIKQIQESGVELPRHLEFELTQMPINSIELFELFFESEQIEQFEQIDHVYQIFKNWCYENNLAVPIKKDLLNYLSNQQENLRIINNLTDFDCDLMKFCHIR
jgi:hypothetical protein